MTTVTAEEFFTVEPKPVVDSNNISANEFFGNGPVKSFQPEDEAEKLGFLQRFEQDIQKRVDMSGEIIQAVMDGEQSTAEGYLQVAGKVGAGAILDFIGQVVISGARGLSAITPDVIEQPLKDGAISAGHEFLNTEVGQKGLDAARQGVEAYKQFRADNPRAARNIEAIVDLGLLLFPAKAKPKTSNPTIIGKAGQKIGDVAAAQVAKNKKAFVDDLILPKQTASVRTEQVARTAEEGLLRSKVVALSPREAAIAQTVNNITGVSSKKTLQGNHAVINKELIKEAESLKSALVKNDVAISRKELLNAGKAVSTKLQKNPLIVGDAEKTAVKIIRKMDDLVKENKPTASGLLQARKDLDVWVRSQKGSNIFDPKQENAISIALREVRESANDLIAKKVPDIGVKESLRKQTNLYRAMDNIAPKAADELSNAVLRAWQNTTRILPFRGEFNQTMAAVFGVGGLGAAAMFAPFFTKLALTGLGTYATGKALMSAPVKKGLALLLTQTDKAIRIAKDPATIQQLRLDRALVLEALQSAQPE